MKMQVKPNGQAVITIPKKLRKAKGWEEGQEIEFSLNNNGNLVLKEEK